MTGAGRAGIGLGGALKTVAAGLAVRQIVKYSDAWTGLQNRLRLVTDSSDELAAVTEEVFQVSQRSRAGLGETADLYARIARSSEELGLTQRDLLGITESVNQAIAISGSSADSANAAIIQLGQGLASGALRGDELRSVLEQTPRLARAIADGLDVPIGALRELGKEGELTSAKVIGALKDQADVLGTEFEQTTSTVAQGFTLLENSLIRAVGLFNDSSGAAGGFAGILKGIADFIVEDFTPGFIEFGDVLAVSFDFAGEALDDFAGRLNKLEVEGEGALDFIGDAFKRLPLSIVESGAVIETEIGALFARIEAFDQKFKIDQQLILARLFGSDEEVEALLKKREQAVLDQASVEREITDERIKLGDKLFENEQKIADAREKRGTLEERLAKLSLDRLNKEQEAAAKAASKDDLKSRDALLKAVKTEQEEFNETIAEATRLNAAGVLVGDEYNKVVQRTSEAYSQTLPEVEAYNDRLEENKKIIEELRSPTELFEERVARLDELADSGQLSWAAYARGVQEARAELEQNDPVLLAQAERMERVQELLEEVQTPQEEFNARMTELRDLLSSDDLSPEQFERLKTAAQTAFEEASIAADPFLQKLQSIGESAGQNIESAFTDFLVDPSKDAFNQMLDSWIETLKRMAAEALTAQLFDSLFGGAGAGAGAGGGGLGGLFAGFLTSGATAADGGTFPGGSPVLVGEEGPELIVPGSRSTVIPNDESMAMMGGAPQVNVTPIINNITDPSAMVSAIESNGGQKAILNAISQNPEAIRRALN
jgi:tape measure domain-containing protein